MGHHHFDPLHLQEWSRDDINRMFEQYHACIEEIAEENTEASCFFVTVVKE